MHKRMEATWVELWYSILWVGCKPGPQILEFDGINSLLDSSLSIIQRGRGERGERERERREREERERERHRETVSKREGRKEWDREIRRETVWKKEWERVREKDRIKSHKQRAIQAEKKTVRSLK